MASSSSSFSKTQADYDVFLSYRGEDTRSNFMSHLDAGLCQKGIYTFVDDDKLDRGKLIPAELLKAIEGSSCCVIFLSRNYASSKRCFEELVKIHQCMKDSAQPQIVLSIFYPDVRKWTPSFGEAFQRHETKCNHNLEKVDRWRNALTEVGNLARWHLQDRGLLWCGFTAGGTEFVFVYLYFIDLLCLVGMCGMGGIGKITLEMGGIGKTTRIMAGIGKTTLARAYYERVSYQFEDNIFLVSSTWCVDELVTVDQCLKGST